MNKSVIVDRLKFARLVVIEQAIFAAELNALHDFATLTESFLGAQAERFAIDTSVPKGLQPGDEEFEAYAGEDLQTTFQEILRFSLLVSAYAMLENLMTKVCKGIGEFKGHSVALEDLQDKGVKRAKLYLKKVAQVEFPDKGQEWSRICSLGKLRNKVVHAGRTIGLNEVDLRTEFSQLAGVSVDTEGAIRLDPTFIPTVVDLFRAFAAQLEHALETLSS